MSFAGAYADRVKPGSESGSSIPQRVSQRGPAAAESRAAPAGTPYFDITKIDVDRPDFDPGAVGGFRGALTGARLQAGNVAHHTY